MLDASIIISTHNRAAILPRLFDSIANLSVNASTTWELLIIDNGSTDDTANVISTEYDRQRLPLSILSEPIPGKSRALNRAIKQAQGELLIFTDDDVETEPDWLQAYVDAAKKHSNIDGFAGRVIPKWLGEIPNWLHVEGEFSLPRGITNTRDFGNQTKILDMEITPGGVNTAIRKSAVLTTGWFRLELGPGTKVPFTEDTEYMLRFKQLGGKFLYVPEALLQHCNIPERMTKDYVYRWMFEVARCQILTFANLPIPNALADIPIYLMRQWLTRYFAWCLDPRPIQRLHKKMKWMFTCGEITGHRQLRSFRKQ